jgi:hypothetical protein
VSNCVFVVIVVELVHNLFNATRIWVVLYCVV